MMKEKTRDFLLSFWVSSGEFSPLRMLRAAMEWSSLGNYFPLPVCIPLRQQGALDQKLLLPTSTQGPTLTGFQSGTGRGYGGFSG